MKKLIAAHRFFFTISRSYKSPKGVKENGLYYAFLPIAYSYFMFFTIRDLLEKK